MTKKLLLLMIFLLTPALCFAQTNKKISELTELGSADSTDVIPITDTSSGVTKKIQVQNLIAGGGLGANLSSSGNQIFSNNGTIDFDDDDIVTSGRFVSTSSETAIMNSLQITGSLIMPVGQNCPAAENGQVCIDTNIGGLTSSISFMGAELTKQVVISVPILNFLDASDGQVISYDAVNDYMEFVDIAIDAWAGTPGTLLYPKTPTTTDLAIGATSKSSADHVLNTDGSAEFNKQKAAVDIVMSGDNETNLLFLDGSTDRVGIATNTPQSLLEVAGTLTVSGTGTSKIKFTTCAAADPCTGSGTSELANLNIFTSCAGGICICNSSGVAKAADGSSSCSF